MWSHVLIRSLYHHRSRATDVRNSGDKLMTFCFVIGLRCEDVILFKMKNLHWYTKPFWQRELTSSFCWEEKGRWLLWRPCCDRMNKQETTRSWKPQWLLAWASRECNPWYADTIGPIDGLFCKKGSSWTAICFFTYLVHFFPKATAKGSFEKNTVIKDCDERLPNLDFHLFIYRIRTWYAYIYIQVYTYIVSLCFAMLYSNHPMISWTNSWCSANHPFGLML